jgi:hypothetical protein
MENNRSRYLGAAPFSKDHHHVFFGRTKEVETLARMLNEGDQILLYSKSGVGKTSLIEAGLIEKLKGNRHTHCTLIRFGNYVQGELRDGNPETPLENLIRRVGDPVSPTILSRVMPEYTSLWSRFKTQQKDFSSRSILIFDQFEELFTYPPEQIHEFKTALAELINPYIPERFQFALQVQQDAGNAPLTDEEIYQLYAPMNIKILVAIREDRMSDILQLNEYLPELRHNFYELRPLDAQRAREAIERPAMEAGPFASEPFTFEPAAVDAILKYLSNDGLQPIETTQLQIICRRVEEIRRNWTDQSRKIFLGTELPKFENLMQDFYKSVLEKVGATQYSSTRRFVEESLIHGSQRIPVAKPTCLDILGEEVITILVGEHLMRAEPNSTGGLSFELSHDTLVDPILAMKQERQTQEALAKAEQERKESEAKIEAQLRIMRRSRLMLRRTQIALVFAVVSGIVAATFLNYAIQQKHIAEEQTEKSRNQTRDAVYALKRAIAAEINLEKHIDSSVENLLTKARSYKSNGKDEYAIETLEEAYQLDPTRKDIQELIKEWTK